MSINDVVVIADVASALGMVVTALLIVKLTDITSAMLNVLKAGVDDGQRISGRRRNGSVSR